MKRDVGSGTDWPVTGHRWSRGAVIISWHHQSTPEGTTQVPQATCDDHGGCCLRALYVAPPWVQPTVTWPHR